MLQKSLTSGGKYKFKQKKFYKKFITHIGLPFNMNSKKYPTKPQEETKKVVLEIYNRWHNFSFDINYEHHLVN